MRTTPTNAIAARARDVNPGNNAKTKSQVDPLSQFSNGRIHPPSQSVTAIDETAIMAAYSVSMKSDQRKPLYSVWYPAVNSDSASEDQRARGWFRQSWRWRRSQTRSGRVERT